MSIKKLVKLFHILSNPIFFRALIKGSAAGVEHDRVLRQLEFQTVVDVGANRGQFALIAHRVFPLAKIHSFEPLEEPAAIFRHVFSSDPSVVLHEFAIGPDEKKMPIHVSRADDSSSLLPISSLQNTLFPGTDEKEVRTVQVKPLDAVLSAKDIEKPALLKLDVQGFEREALEGCKSLLALFSYIYVECSFVELYSGQSLAHEIISLLDEFGFIVSGIYNLSYDRHGIAVQGDFLFKKRNS
jgi:FkbM family methyltransferase